MREKESYVKIQNDWKGITNDLFAFQILSNCSRRAIRAVLASKAPVCFTGQWWPDHWPVTTDHWS